MRVRPVCAALAAVTALAWCGPGASSAQDAPVAPRDPTVLVHDTTGATHRLVHARLFAEAVGLLSVSLEATEVFTLTIGQATVKVPVRLIRSIEFGGGETPGAWTTVTVTDREGHTVSGTPITPDKAEIRGERADARFAMTELKLNGVSKIVWEGAAPATVCAKCQRASLHPDWKFCPHDGQRYPKDEDK